MSGAVGIVFDITDGSWHEALSRAAGITETRSLALGVVPDGMVSGRPTVFVRIDDEATGRIVLAEVPLQLLGVAVDALRAHHGDGSGPSPHRAATPKSTVDA